MKTFSVEYLFSGMDLWKTVLAPSHNSPALSHSQKLGGNIPGIPIVDAGLAGRQQTIGQSKKIEAL
jgi:hypothetical protein